MRWLLGTAAVLLGIVGFFASAYLHWDTPLGRAATVQLIEWASEREMPGSVRIGRLDSIGLGHFEAQDVRILAVNGDPVIEAHRAKGKYDLGALLGLKISMRELRVDGGAVTIREQPDGSTDIERAFDSPGPSSGPTLEVDIRSMHAEGIVLAVHTTSGSQYRIENVASFLSILKEGDNAVEVSLGRGSGTLVEPSPLSLETELSAISGIVRGGGGEVLRLDFEASVEGAGTLEGRLRYRPDASTKVKLDLHLQDVSLSTLAGIGFDVASWFLADVTVDLHAGGEPGDEGEGEGDDGADEQPSEEAQSSEEVQAEIEDAFADVDESVDEDADLAADADEAFDEAS